jgi:glycogen synthase
VSARVLIICLGVPPIVEGGLARHVRKLSEELARQDVGLRFRWRDPRSLARMVERLITDDDLRDRLVTEASEHVLRFDWSDVSRQTGELYGELPRARV